MKEFLPYRWERRRFRSRRAALGEGRPVCERKLPGARGPRLGGSAPRTAQPRPAHRSPPRLDAPLPRPSPSQGGRRENRESLSHRPALARHSQLFQTRLVLCVSSWRGPRSVGRRLRRWQSWVLLPGRKGSGGDGARARGSCLVCFSGCEQSSLAVAPWAAETRLVCKGGGGRRKGRGASEGRQAMVVGVKLVTGHRLAVAGFGALVFRRRGKDCTPSVSWGSLPFVTWKLWTPE